MTQTKLRRMLLQTLAGDDGAKTCRNRLDVHKPDNVQ